MRFHRGIFIRFFLFLIALLMVIPDMSASAKTRYGRIEGLDRYETSIRLSNRGWTKSDYAILATGEDFPDALGAAPLAKKYKAPILLTAKDGLSEELQNELSRLMVKKVFILGGIGVISQSIDNMLVRKGIEVVRLAGSDRYETSVKIAVELGGFDKIAVASGDIFTDALSISTAAASLGMPVILTGKDAITPQVKAFISQNPSIKKTYVIGGTGVISDAVSGEFPNVERIYGDTKYQRNINIINKFESSMNFSNIYISTGGNFPDSLSGSALAALTNSPVILADKNHSSNAENIMEHKDVKNVIALGGPGAVSENVLESILKDSLVKSNEIFMYDLTDWSDTSLAGELGAGIMGSPHGPVIFFNDGYDDQNTIQRWRTNLDSVHKSGLKFVMHLTFDPMKDVFTSGNAPSAIDISGNHMTWDFPPAGRPIYSVFDPELKGAFVQYMKLCVDLGVDGFVNDCFGAASDNATERDGDFSQYALKYFNEYLSKKYSNNELKILGIQDVGSFNYADFIRKNYMNQYQNDRNSIPLFRDFIICEQSGEIEFWKQVNDEIRAYGEDKGKTLIFTSNSSESSNNGRDRLNTTGLAADGAVDFFMSEYNYGIPPKSNGIAFYKVYNALGRDVVSLTNDIFSAKFLTRPDIANLMKLYTAEAYATGNYTYVPYANNCLNADRSDFIYYSIDDLKQLYPYYDFISENSGVFGKLESVSSIGVMYSYASIKNESGTADEDRTATQNFYGISNMLNDYHYQYDVLFAGDNNWIEDKYTANDLDNYDVIILPGPEDLTDKQANDILEYVNQGGTVLAFGRPGVNDEDGSTMARPKLKQLLNSGSHSYGEGKFIYIDGNAGMNYLSSPSYQNASAVISALGKSGGRPNITTSASNNVYMLEYWSGDLKSTVIHMINYNYSEGDGKFIAQQNIAMKVALDGGSAGSKPAVYYMSPDGIEKQQLNSTFSGGYVSFTIPSLDTYGIIVIS